MKIGAEEISTTASAKGTTVSDQMIIRLAASEIMPRAMNRRGVRGIICRS